MKRIATTIVLSTALLTGPVMAGSEGNLMSKENVGGALGATVGAVVGSKFGDGDGQLATTAIGAVGGYVVGRNLAHNYRGGYSPGYRSHRWHGRSHGRDHDRRGYKPRIQPINKLFVARTTSNVRSGPSTRFRIIDRLRDRERVRVEGKVYGRNWFMVRTRHGRGFVYAPLLRRPYHGYRWDRDRDHDRDRDDRHHRNNFRGRWYR